jgi:hypothetical protein
MPWELGMKHRARAELTRTLAKNPEEAAKEERKQTKADRDRPPHYRFIFLRYPLMHSLNAL